MQLSMTMEKTNNSELRFDGSIWCNLDIALRNVDQVFRQSLRTTGLTVIEWYILRALYKQDGQHASELATAVGRAATSFTPNLDKLQKKDLIERRPDRSDRRAVRIYLTDLAKKRKSEFLESAEDVDEKLNALIPTNELETFNTVLGILQNLSTD